MKYKPKLFVEGAIIECHDHWIWLLVPFLDFLDNWQKMNKCSIPQICAITEKHDRLKIILAPNDGYQNWDKGYYIMGAIGLVESLNFE